MFSSDGPFELQSFKGIRRRPVAAATLRQTTLGQQNCIFRIGEVLFPADGSSCGIVMQFNRVSGPVEDLHMWSATSNGFSFVISFETRNGPGLRGRHGYLASWRPIHQSRCAIKVGGSPFPTLIEAEIACSAILAHLIRPD